MTRTIPGDYWWPKWSPDGRLILAGNVRGALVDPASGNVTDLGPGRSWGWYGQRVVAWIDAHDERTLRSRHMDTDIERVLSGDAAGNWIAIDPPPPWSSASTGHWASVLASDGRLIVDGEAVLVRAHGLALGWPWVVVSSPEGDVFEVYDWSRPPEERHVASLLRPRGAHEWTVRADTLAWAGSDVRVRPSVTGLPILALVAPWVGREWSPRLVRAGDDLWLWTASEHPDGTPLLLGRPPGSLDVVVVRGVAAKTFDVVVRHDQFHIAAYSDHEGSGRPGLQVVSVPVDAPRERLTAPPAPPPQPEIWTPTTETVDLWALFVGSSGSQYPRRHPDDAGIYWDCQLVRTGHHVEHAYFVKTPNGRVYEWRATWADDETAWIGLIEDHDEDGRIYQFRDPRLMRRFARAGDQWSWRTQLREWDHARKTWGPWTGPGTGGTFAFRVTVRSVERSSYGRLRATIDVDTYQDCEVFELYSNKGWSAWEEWTASTPEGDPPMPAGWRERGLRVGRRKRVEWPERYDGPRPWPVPPFGAWRGVPAPPAPTQVTIAKPETWPQISQLVDGKASLRCIAVVTSGPAPAYYEWLIRSGAWSSSVRNPADDADHTFLVTMPGAYEIALRALDREGRLLDETGRRRVWTVVE